MATDSTQRNKNVIVLSIIVPTALLSFAVGVLIGQSHCCIPWDTHTSQADNEPMVSAKVHGRFGHFIR